MYETCLWVVRHLSPGNNSMLAGIGRRVIRPGNWTRGDGQSSLRYADASLWKGVSVRRRRSLRPMCLYKDANLAVQLPELYRNPCGFFAAEFPKLKSKQSVLALRVILLYTDSKTKFRTGAFLAFRRSNLHIRDRNILPAQNSQCQSYYNKSRPRGPSPWWQDVSAKA